MKKFATLLLALALLLLLGGGVGYWSWQRRAPAVEPGAATPAAEKRGDDPGSATPRWPKREPVTGLSAEEKTARAEKIRRDYDEITRKISADYSAAGDAFPGGLNAFLRQLALLTREKHADLAALLTPREREDIEMRDTPAGQMVQRLLGDTAATDQQRRAVLALEAAFEDKFALTFDLTPPALLAREKERQATQTSVRRVLGDEVFGAWLVSEGNDFAAMTAFARERGFASSVPLELWRAKSDFTLARLELKVRADLTVAQQVFAEETLANQINVRVAGIIGPLALATGGRDVLSWLPRAPANPPPGR